MRSQLLRAVPRNCGFACTGVASHLRNPRIPICDKVQTPAATAGSMRAQRAHPPGRTRNKPLLTKASYEQDIHANSATDNVYVSDVMCVCISAQMCCFTYHGIYVELYMLKLITKVGARQCASITHHHPRAAAGGVRPSLAVPMPPSLRVATQLAPQLPRRVRLAAGRSPSHRGPMPMDLPPSLRSRQPRCHPGRRHRRLRPPPRG